MILQTPPLAYLPADYVEVFPPSCQPINHVPVLILLLSSTRCLWSPHTSALCPKLQGFPLFLSRSRRMTSDSASSCPLLAADSPGGLSRPSWEVLPFLTVKVLLFFTSTPPSSTSVTGHRSHVELGAHPQPPRPQKDLSTPISVPGSPGAALPVA